MSEQEQHMFIKDLLNKKNTSKSLNLPTRITLIRILLVPVFVFLLIRYRFTAGASAGFKYGYISIFIIAIISDALDGFLARILNMRTSIGAVLDPIADKILLIASIIILSIPLDNFLSFPLWFAVLVISRDIIILTGSLIIYITKNALWVKPAILGKITTFLQMMLITLMLIEYNNLKYLIYITAFFTLISGINYIKNGCRQLA